MPASRLPTTAAYSGPMVATPSRCGCSAEKPDTSATATAERSGEGPPLAPHGEHHERQADDDEQGRERPAQCVRQQQRQPGRAAGGDPTGREREQPERGEERTGDDADGVLEPAVRGRGGRRTRRGPQRGGRHQGHGLTVGHPARCTTVRGVDVHHSASGPAALSTLREHGSRSGTVSKVSRTSPESSRRPENDGGHEDPQCRGARPPLRIPAGQAPGRRLRERGRSVGRRARARREQGHVHDPRAQRAARHPRPRGRDGRDLLRRVPACAATPTCRTCRAGCRWCPCCCSGASRRTSSSCTAPRPATAS